MYAKRRRGRFAGFALAIVCGLGATFGARAAERQRVWHFAANENFDAAGAFLPSSAGFNLADVSSRRELDLLPRGTMGLAWVGLHNPVQGGSQILVLADTCGPPAVAEAVVLR